MSKIKIKSNKCEEIGFAAFSFGGGHRELICESTPLEFCFCGYKFDRRYSYIIHSLKDKGLLEENYEELCCFCNLERDGECQK